MNRIAIRRESDGAVFRAFLGTRCLATALLRRPYSQGPLWTISYSNGERHGTADTNIQMRRELLGAAAAFRAREITP